MQHIVDTLWQLHNNPSGDHASALIDLNIEFDEGQAIQLELLNRWLEAGKSIGGWKIGMTSGASRNAMGDGLRPFGFILNERIFASGATLALTDLHRGQVENELCIVMATSLGAGATAATARAAAAGIAPGFEINQKRLPPDAAPGLRVADNLSNWGIVAGELVPPPPSLPEMTVTLSQVEGENDTVIESVPSADHIDDHFESLATLARRLSDFGHSLLPGQRIITGAYGKSPFAPGSYRGDFDQGVGSVTVHLS